MSLTETELQAMKQKLEAADIKLDIFYRDILDAKNAGLDMADAEKSYREMKLKVGKMKSVYVR